MVLEPQSCKTLWEIVLILDITSIAAYDLELDNYGKGEEIRGGRSFCTSFYLHCSDNEANNAFKDFK